MKKITIIICGLLFLWTTQTNAIEMFGKETYGFDIPKYSSSQREVTGAKLVLMTIADSDNFPISSYEQGSIFNKIFSNLREESNVEIVINPREKDFENIVEHFERGGAISGSMDYMGYPINGIFGAPHKERIYSRNKDIYPAFFVNNIHVLTTPQAKLDLKDRKDLKNYKGIYVKTDRIADNILNDFSNLNITAVNSFSEAYEQLLTNKIDFLAASYYPSLLEAYKLGIRDLIVYSKNPVWKMPLFIRVRPNILKNKQVEELSKYLKSPQYKKALREALEELVDIYQRNTAGVVPPTYTGDTENEEIEDKTIAPIEQKLEN